MMNPTMRCSRCERGQPEDAVRDLDLGDLIGAVRKDLAWDVPKHYMAKHTMRLLRNAVIHGGELPTTDGTEFRPLFDKWKLFFFRRVLMRVGYTGNVVSPHMGWASRSAVADFSEEHNLFTPADPKDDPFMKFVRKVREQQNPSDHAEIAERAYQIFEEHGSQHGHDLDNWLQAERELRGDS